MFIKALVLALTFTSIPTSKAVTWKQDKPQYTSDLEKLVDTEKQVIRDFQDYITKESNRLEVLGVWLKRLNVEYRKASRNVNYYLGNPINAYTLIKRLSSDLMFMEKVIRNEPIFQKNPLFEFPTEADLIDSIKALDLLRDKYDLSVTQLANGILQSNYSQSREMYTEVVAPMKGTHLYMIATTFISNGDYIRGLPWVLEIYRFLEQGRCKDCKFTKLDVIKDILAGYLRMGDYENYIIWDEKRIALDPTQAEDHEVRMALKRAYEEKVADQPKSAKVQPEVTKEYFQRLCRGDFKRNSLKRSHVCYYSRPHPVLFLSPVKTELLYQSPLVMMFHGIVSEQQTDVLRKIARPKLKDQPLIEKSPFHVPVAKLPDSASPLVSYLSKKVSLLTGFNVDHTQPWKVINYGVGRMYPLHEDKPGKPKKDVGKYKKPVAKMGTFMVYLSNVTLGGAMTFPALRLTVFPEQGSALFWLNELPSGQPDRAVVHVECAALRGQKWYAVKWPFEYLQKQCPIWKTEEGIVTEETYFKVVEQHRNLWKTQIYKQKRIDLSAMLKKPSYKIPIPNK